MLHSVHLSLLVECAFYPGGTKANVRPILALHHDKSPVLSNTLEYGSLAIGQPRYDDQHY
jgi:hypothetical protein